MINVAVKLTVKEAIINLERKKDAKDKYLRTDIAHNERSVDQHPVRDHDPALSRTDSTQTAFDIYVYQGQTYLSGISNRPNI